MSLYDDEALKQEVIYLHSLWLQGPPTRNPNPIQSPGFDPIQRPRPNYISPADLHLPSRYEPVAVRSHLVPRNPNYPNHLFKRPRPDPGPEWPVKVAQPSPPMKSGWREFRPNPSKKPRNIPTEELAKLAAKKLQKDVLLICRKFFAQKSGDDGSSTAGDVAEGSEGDDDQSSANYGSSAEFEFLSRMFVENGELKEYYEKNARSGEFWCLACCGGEKSVRKFKSCLALVQHSLTIHKTDMKTAHRAFAHVVCNVLGWDVNNPVASSQKDTQVSCEGPDVAGQPECSSNPKNPEEKEIIPAEEQLRATGLQMQQKVSEAIRDFFTENADSIDETEKEHKDVDDSLSKEFKFFSGVLLENDELKKYYGENYKSGDFICLVCAGIGKKGVLKSFKGCFSLLQHCIQGQNTKKQAHRSFVRITCKLLGWDFDLLPFTIAKGDDPPQVDSSNGSPSAINEEHLIQGKPDTTKNNDEGGSGSGI